MGIRQDRTGQRDGTVTDSGIRQGRTGQRDGTVTDSGVRTGQQCQDKIGQIGPVTDSGTGWRSPGRRAGAFRRRLVTRFAPVAARRSPPVQPAGQWSLRPPAGKLGRLRRTARRPRATGPQTASARRGSLGEGCHWDAAQRPAGCSPREGCRCADPCVRETCEKE